jgi:two-component system LytT family response regulator
MKYKVLIIDDEKLAIDLLEDYCRKISSLEVAGTFTDPNRAFDFLQQEQVDLVFLDINMPELTGLELARLIPSQTAVIFATAYREFGVEAFDLKALDYLLKPISYPRFLDAINRFFDSREKPVSVKTEELIIVRADRMDYRIQVGDILYIEGLKDYVKVVTRKGTLLTKSSIGNFLKEQLPNDRFIRVHRSYVVSREKIMAVGKEEVIIGEHRIPIGISYRGKLEGL